MNIDTLRQIRHHRTVLSYFSGRRNNRRRNVAALLDGNLARTLHAMNVTASPDQVTQMQKLLMDTFRLGFEAGIRHQ